MLVARDEQSCLVVSYKDIKTCIANAFECVFSLGTFSLARVLMTDYLLAIWFVLRRRVRLGKNPM